MDTNYPYNPNAAQLPIYQQITEQITRSIIAGHLIEGERLPPERTLASKYRVSVTTLRKSLLLLEKNGLLQRIHGSGNYVRHNTNPSAIYAFYRLELISGGGLPSAELISAEYQPKAPDLPKFGHSSSAIRFRRIRFLDRIPIAIEEIWLDNERAKEVAISDISPSLYQYYQEQFDIRIVRAEDWIGVAPLPNWAGKHFPVKQGSLCGFIERYGWDQKHQKVEYSRNWFDTSTARYVSRLK